MNPILTIIVPIYNVEEYLSKCIESILNQTFNNFELILINDGSTDNSLYICKEYQKKDNRIKVINKKNSGVSSSRNLGIDSAIGKYIAFVDPDDDIERNMYEELIKRMIRYNPDIIVSSFKYINLINNTIFNQKLWYKTESIIWKEEIEKEIFLDILSFKEGYGIYSSVNKVYRKEIFYKYNIRFDENLDYGEDARLNLKFLTKINSIYFVDIPFYNYYIRKRKSLTQILRKNFYDYILDNKKFHKNLCELYGYNNLISIGIDHYLNTTMMYMISISKSALVLNEKVNILKKIITENTFVENIKQYNCPHKFYRVLKIACINKQSYIFMLLIKILQIKENFRVRRLS